jgi:quercetin dioxygenase-like cupin family protein
MGVTVEFENERVRVLRVKHEGRERHPHTSRHDRLIIYLNEGRVMRTENGKQEEIRRKAGEVVWKKSSEHQIENLKDSNHETIIVEFKP